MDLQPARLWVSGPELAGLEPGLLISHLHNQANTLKYLTINLDDENPYVTDFSTGNKNSASLSSLGAFAGSNSTKEMSSETLLESCRSGSRQVLQ